MEAEMEADFPPEPGPAGDSRNRMRNIKPVREPLQFDVHTENVSPETAQVVSSIKELAESLLFHWKSFPIILPDSITERRAVEASRSGEFQGAVKFKDLFVAPIFDELELVATDEEGNLKKLSRDQLAMIRKKGEFDVPSVNFPGQTHRWRLSMLIQKGSERTSSSLYSNLATSLSLLIITARDRFCSGFFSITESVKGWGNGLRNLLDIIIGMPSMTPGDLCQKLHEERMRYLVAELDIKPSLKKELNTYCEYVKNECNLLAANKYKTTDYKPPPIPYRYQTPKGQDIDLRLFNKDLMNNSMGILSNILDRQSKGWHVQMRAKLIRHYQGQGLSNEQISKHVTEDIMNHYLEKVFTAIENNAELDVLQPGLGTLLVNQAKSVLAMKKAKANVERSMEEHKEQLLTYLKTTYPIKSRISKWVNEKVKDFEANFVRQNLWTAHEEAISICEEEHLDQTVYFLRRDLNFIKERELVLRKELGRVKSPTRQYSFSTTIWFPHNYVVRKWENYGKGEIIPTVIRDAPPDKEDRDPNTRFTVEKSTKRYTSTRYPFWRWWNYLHRTWSTMWNAMFMFGVLIPWCSPVSFRALVWPYAFIPDKEQSDVDGSLYPRKSSLTHTLVSRLKAIWHSVADSRAKFEAAPDRGFLGKSFTRHMNRFWNYVIKGALGSVMVVLFFPVLCVTASTLSVVVGILSPVWVPVAVLMAQVFFFLIYDFDSPWDKKNRLFILFEALIWNILIQGCLQPVSALIVGAVACPLGSLAVALFGLIRSGCRSLWDFLMFHIIVKSRGRVPSHDGFVARRIAGPGLASNYFYQIRPEQALAAVEARIESDELQAWKKEILAIVEQPRDQYKKFVEECFQPFSASLIEKGVYAALSRELSHYITEINSRVTKREAALFTGLNSDLQRRIKLQESDLKLTLVYTAKLLEEFFPEHVIQRQNIAEEEFWENESLEFRDWRGFASKKLKEIFSPAFMVPLEETDNYFQLKVNHITVGSYAEMLANADIHDDLDVVVELHTPEGDINVLAPNLEVSYFDPKPLSWRSSGCVRLTTFTPADFDKLEVPLPIPHPASIAIAIYNRENDQEPIDLNDPSCQRIVRATKEAYRPQRRTFSEPVKMRNLRQRQARQLKQH